MSQNASWLLYKTDQGIPQLLSKALYQEQFQEVSDSHTHDSWNLYWKACGFTHSDYRNVKGWQILNHFPKGNTITRKDSLARCLKRMRMVYGSIYNFFPVSFNLPNDYTNFLSYFTKIQNKRGKQVWICKPSDLSRGRGIFLFNSLSDLLYEGSTVVQRYIDDPYLIGGYKFDLRLYAVVTSYHPLRIYLHHDGLVRFGTEKYTGSLLQNRFAHLTNTSINRHGPSYNTDKERVGPGCKWSISQLRAYFQQCSVDDRLVWERIKHLISLTVIMQANSIPESAKQCIELYGFDVILDHKLKPWLLEVNFTPALGNDCTADVTVKLPMLVDLLTLAKQKIHFPRPTTDHLPRRLSRQASIRRQEQHLLGLLMRQTSELSALRRDKADQGKLMKSIARHESLRKKCRMLFLQRSREQEVEDKEEENVFDDVFRNRFIMDPEEIERMKGIERRCMKIPGIKNTTSIIEQNSVSVKSTCNHDNSVSITSNSANSSTKPSQKHATSQRHTARSRCHDNTARSHSSSSFRKTTNLTANYPRPEDCKIGGFFLTYPISAHSCELYNKGCTDTGKAVAEIRSVLRTSEKQFKFLPTETRELYERTTINWNVLSGFKT